MTTAGSSPIDWDSIRDEATTHLQQLIRIDTTNPPGNEAAAAGYLRSVLAAEGIEGAVYESAPGRGSFYARLKSSGQKRPLLLVAHLDVVPVEEAKWHVPPFDGVVKDGCVWGRGALDCKGLVVMELMVMLLLKRRGVQLARDVAFLATADEETGGKMGVVWMLENHPDLLDCEFALNESGGQGVDVGNRRLYLCQVSEKGGARMKLRASGTAGHASVPSADNAVLKLAQALAQIQPRSMPVHITSTARRFVEEVAEAYSGADRQAVLDLLDPQLTNEALSHLPDPWLADTLSTLLRNSATPTLLKAGDKINVIPSQAEAGLDCRALPGYDAADVQRELRALIPDEAVEISPVVPGAPPLTYELGTDNELFRAIVATMAELDPGSHVVPQMLSGATDSRYLVPRGVIVHGFGPALRPDYGLPAFHGLGHSHNERIPIENLSFGARVIYEIVRKVCAG